MFPALSFTLPLLMVQAPADSSRWFVVEKGGRIRSFANDNAANSTTLFVDLTARVNSGSNEAGLLGFAFHPRFAQNGQVFVSYTGYGGPINLRSTISRFVSRDGGKTLDPASEQVLLTLDQPYSNHNGGWIAVGPDGHLYVAFGDGGSGGDPQKNGQNTNVLLGKILRLDVDTVPMGKTYGIPATNPFAQGGGRPEIYAWGFRNPWRCSFDPPTGELWCGDVGQNAIEEVDRVRLGGNYGWNVKEGTSCYGQNPCNLPGLIDPVVQYTHAEGISITGGFVYRGPALPSLRGRYVYGDYGSGRIWSIGQDPMTGLPRGELLLASGRTISTFAVGADGELHLLDYSSGRIYKLVPSGNPPPDTFPKTLTATGCVDPKDPTRFVAGVIPYDVASPLWSDGADKERGFALPDGTTIQVGADGDFDLPVGAVTLKTFSVGGKRVETRYFVRHGDGNWAGYSYEWNDQQTEATLLDGGKLKAVGKQSWPFPSRGECFSCHTAAAGRTLGLEAAQLNTAFTYPGGRRANQLVTLEAIGLFAQPLGVRPALPAPSGNAPLEDRARSYLHANCAFCHRPGGPGGGTFDLRYATPFKLAGLCSAPPTQGGLGIPGALLVAPGDPDKSLLAVRPRRLDVARMPPLASLVVDPAGTQLIDDWIRSLVGCPK